MDGLFPSILLLLDGTDAADWEDVLSALTGSISVSTVAAVLATVAGACVGLAFMWWAVRKATRALMSAFKKGKVSL